MVCGSLHEAQEYRADRQLKLLSWDNFRYVSAIAHMRSLGAAAKALGVDHATIFRRLRRIENKLGSRLFERSGSNYAPTPCCKEMIKLADRFAKDIANFERRTIGYDLRASGELRISTNDIVLLHLLTDVLVGFRGTHPEITFEITVSDTSLDLPHPATDVSVYATYPAAGLLAGRHLRSMPWAVFGPKNLDRTCFNLTTDPARHNWVVSRDDVTLARVEKWLKNHGVAGNRVVYKVNTLLGIAEAVAKGAGLALLPRFIGDRKPGISRLSRSLPELEGQLRIVANRNHQGMAKVSAFIDYCESKLVSRIRS